MSVRRCRLSVGVCLSICRDYPERSMMYHRVGVFFSLLERLKQNAKYIRCQAAAVR